MDKVQKFISENSHQFGYIMQEASSQWIAKDPDGALTVGACNGFVKQYGDYHTILDKLQAIEEPKVAKKDVYKAVMSGHIFIEPEMGSNIELFTHTNNDDTEAEIFEYLDLEILSMLEHHLEEKEEHFFVVVVYARPTSWQSQEGTEYGFDYDIREIGSIEDLDKGVEF
jgi:hypothetical protein